jgi:hypothetical protein
MGRWSCSVQRQNVAGGQEKDAWRRALGGKEKEQHVSSCDSSSALEYDGALRHHCSAGHESVSSGMELHLRRRTHASRRAKGQKSFTDHESNAGEERDKNPSSRTQESWPAVLKAKCEVLQMEKELADQKFRHQCAEMAQAAEMAHCLRASVQTILEVHGALPNDHASHHITECLQYCTDLWFWVKHKL